MDKLSKYFLLTLCVISNPGEKKNTIFSFVFMHPNSENWDVRIKSRETVETEDTIT